MPGFFQPVPSMSPTAIPSSSQVLQNKTMSTMTMKEGSLRYSRTFNTTYTMLTSNLKKALNLFDLRNLCNAHLERRPKGFGGHNALSATRGVYDALDTPRTVATLHIKSVRLCGRLPKLQGIPPWQANLRSIVDALMCSLTDFHRRRLETTTTVLYENFILGDSFPQPGTTIPSHLTKHHDLLCAASPPRNNHC